MTSGHHTKRGMAWNVVENWGGHHKSKERLKGICKETTLSKCLSFLGRPNKVPSMGYKTTNAFSLSSRGQESEIEVWAGRALCEGSREDSFLASSSSWYLLAILGLP